MVSELLFSCDLAFAKTDFDFRDKNAVRRTPDGVKFYIVRCDFYFTTHNSLITNNFF